MINVCGKKGTWMILAKIQHKLQSWKYSFLCWLAKEQIEDAVTEAREEWERERDS